MTHDSSFYVVCKKHTRKTKASLLRISNNRCRLSSKCVQCGKSNSVFVKKPSKQKGGQKGGQRHGLYKFLYDVFDPWGGGHGIRSPGVF